MTIEDFFSLLEGVKACGSGWTALCPAHGDRTSSLSVSLGEDGKILLKCFAGCTTESICHSLGIGLRDLFPDNGSAVPAVHPPARPGWNGKRIEAKYDYLDETGTLLYQAVRYSPKGFSQRRPDGKGGWAWNLEGVRRVLYRLPELIGSEPRRGVFLVEGEKDADRLAAWGLIATTNPQGAGKWRDEYSECLRGRTVYILPDNDTPGRSHADAVARSLQGIAASVKTIDLPGLPPKGDVSEWIDAGGTKADLRGLCEKAPAWTPGKIEIVDPGPSVSAESKVDEPIPLDKEIAHPQPYPIDALGTILGPSAVALNNSIQAPLAMCGQSVLAASSLTVQGHADIEIDGRVFPVSEYFLSIGISGERKSAVDTQALKAHRERERQLSIDYHREQEAYKRDSEAFKAAQHAAKSGRGKKNYNAMRQALEELGPAPEPPLSPVMTGTDPTIEGLYRSFKDGIPSQGIFSDEGGQLIGGHAMNSENILKTAAALSSLWDGKRTDRIRAGDGQSILYGRRLCVHLMAQPTVADLLIGNGTLKEQGLLSRMLLTHPESTMGSRKYREIDISQDPALMNYWHQVEAILDYPLPLVNGKKNELDPRARRPSPEAKRLWISFHDEVEEQLADGGRFAGIRGFANKGPEHALRLAGILTLFDDIDATEIPLDKMAAGIELAMYYLDEAVRLAATEHPDIRLAKHLLGWAKGQGKFVYMRRILQLGPNPLRDKKTAARIVEILVSHRWFIPIPGGMRIDGAHRQEVFEVRS